VLCKLLKEGFEMSAAIALSPQKLSDVAAKRYIADDGNVIEGAMWALLFDVILVVVVIASVIAWKHFFVGGFVHFLHQHIAL
jgi:hypothetical protein